MNKEKFSVFFKKYKKAIIVFFVATICFALSPVIYEFAMPKFGKITYKINGYGLSFEPKTNNKNKHEQFGKIGELGEKITLVEEYGYSLDSWSDNSTSLIREDYFEYGSKTFIAKSRYANFELANINIEVPYSSIPSSKNKVKAVMNVQNEERTIVFDNISFFNGFENKNGQPKKDVLLTKKNDGLQEFWIGKSMHYDKTLLRQKIAIDLFNNASNTDDVLFHLSNTYFNNEYFGCYLFQKIGNLKDTCLISCSNLDSINFDFSINGRKFVVINNNSSMNKERVEEIVSKYLNSENKLQYIDMKNASKKAALSYVFNNSAEFENDVLFTVDSNSNIRFCGVDSFTLSMGLYRYSDYSPTSNTRFNILIDPLFNYDTFCDYFSSEITSLKSCFQELTERIDDYSIINYPSFLENNKKYPVKSTFGTPNELINCSTYEEHFNYLKNWLLARYQLVNEKY